MYLASIFFSSSVACLSSSSKCFNNFIAFIFSSYFVFKLPLSSFRLSGILNGIGGGGTIVISSLSSSGLISVIFSNFSKSCVLLFSMLVLFKGLLYKRFSNSSIENLCKT